ncbi:phosphotransferase enzyme family protein [Brachybacterium kimchii]|uniref:Phosphotransferase n=1 Tax=Brachybacterium kimchii TaxID=2942909 RepID=A0ABY4N1Y1_9MICO|nr:phosphotransferase [Brachybacterium kimchii]UQN28543.1 phosphotransferase [Brachybacterium kimchii]
METGDDAREIPLTGGNASAGVVRVGDTVRKPWHAGTPLVARYTEALRAAGIDVPAHLGRDDTGRQIIEHVPGVLAMDIGQLDVGRLERVGRLVRDVHEASAALPRDRFPLSPIPGITAAGRGTSDPLGARWEVLLPAPTPPELICHHDIAPWNLLVDGERMILIDLDGAGPSTRAWDLAYAAQSFSGMVAGADPADVAARLRALVVDGYEADADLRAQLPRLLAERTQAMHDLLVRSHAEGREPWGSMFMTGHGEHWREAAAFAAAHEGEWRGALS